MGATVGTRLMTWWKGAEVGKDGFGNRYFREKSGGDRRWVIYEGDPEASKVPAEWHAWLHHTCDAPPLGARPKIPWEKPHLANQTGTSGAYRPGGSVLSDRERQKSGGDYQAWTPE
ncbi:MAG: NADH:ubiquinone oxidoreductase subunit NDUFA12 [Alphaproteobacteria bacterium]|jgi:NADH:ubiquinone oxidoreductase subunit|nr:NADH:ubiquinone oxidoreductase subunit NDUFA12 [Rhodospirillaceae bacterium]MDP6020577.1 NADH:ubiquinone oxidoreductase subunit NDUFA12 [Alphaproteobacteria bacterium]MDP6255182.1 NADH:ubiquinone oxidoreductase subunit NDUFA12 [Alphaproteobacteria bacterium]MDP7052602.1 NADH:ubiquinone oxidoreductase subunit NDUFA12 [Alphaproteobacteria bacterium]MDP7229719.1 NADH:ubiquinone oxidoreductase subunit NDUFA12 [Alphaproteobacteria bacterium]|tara:strand:+ start:4153 stop:4500 length:348 start_codon:yes stop_codon:yes gene_type:complete